MCQKKSNVFSAQGTPFGKWSCAPLPSCGVYGTVPSGTTSSPQQEVYAGENVSILCQPGYLPARLYPMTQLLVPGLVGDAAFNISCVEREQGPRFSDGSITDDSKCQEQGVCTASNPFGQVVRTKKACRALLTDAVWLPMYWCVNGGGAGGGGDRLGKQCQGRATSYCGANLMCLPKKEPFVCVRGAAEAAGRTCTSLDAAGDSECVSATLRGTICIPCAADTFQAQSPSGSNICMPCPANSDTRGVTGAFTPARCLCKAGFARQQSSLGEAAPCSSVPQRP